MVQIVTFDEFKEFKEEVLDAINELKSKPENESTNRGRWIRSHEVKKLLNISHGKLQQMRDSHQLKFTKIGRILFYDMRDIERMMSPNKKA